MAHSSSFFPEMPGEQSDRDQWVSLIVETKARIAELADHLRASAAYASRSQKIKSLDELAATIATAKSRGLRVAHCHGVFDLIHPGHVRHLKAAKALADILVVTITADRFVNKGPGRPAFNESLRAEFLATLEPVDFVGINPAPAAVELIHQLKPDIYVKGNDYARSSDDPTGKISEEEAAIIAVGGRIHFTDEITSSSSSLINNYMNVFPPEVEGWLRDFRKNYSANQVMEYIDRAAEKKVLVVGEPIIDEYVFCEALGKSSKDPILAFNYRSTESYAGGSAAVANHLAGIGAKVQLIGQLGERERREDFIRERLQAQVEPIFPTRYGAPTITKRRFVDRGTSARLIELYFIDDSESHLEDQQSAAKLINELAPENDVVIVADYGHGMLEGPAVQSLLDRSRFLAVNTQANAGNRGFNTISKYCRADYVCLAGPEAQLEARMKQIDWLDLIQVISTRIACPRFTITRGRAGTFHFTKPDQFTEAPALATVVTDRVGAGDAVLAITSPLYAIGAPQEVIGFISNLVGALMVADLGVRTTITRANLAKAVQSLLK